MPEAPSQMQLTQMHQDLVCVSLHLCTKQPLSHLQRPACIRSLCLTSVTPLRALPTGSTAPVLPLMSNLLNRDVKEQCSQKKVGGGGNTYKKKTLKNITWENIPNRARVKNFPFDP